MGLTADPSSLPTSYTSSCDHRLHLLCYPKVSQDSYIPSCPPFKNKLQSQDYYYLKNTSTSSYSWINTIFLDIWNI